MPNTSPRRSLIEFEKLNDNNIDHKLFSDENIEGQNINGRYFKFCTLHLIGAKKVTWENVDFKNCQFDECYLNGSVFKNCRFIGCRFDRCSFTNAKFVESEISFSRFNDCALTAQQLEHCTYKSPTDRARLLFNLYEENKKLGYWNTANTFLVKGFDEEAKHYKYIFTAYNDHYKENYTTYSRINYFFRYVFARISRFLWGYGLNKIAYARNMILYLCCMPILIFFFDKDPAKKLGDVAEKYTDYFHYNLVISAPFTNLSRDGFYNIKIQFTPWWLEILCATCGLVLFSIFLSVLFKSISRD